MTYRGKVKGGVVLEPGARLDEGADVVVEQVEPGPAGAWQTAGPMMGKAKGLPADAARNIDRDLYGQSQS